MQCSTKSFTQTSAIVGAVSHVLEETK